MGMITLGIWSYLMRNYWLVINYRTNLLFIVAQLRVIHRLFLVVMISFNSTRIAGERSRIKGTAHRVIRLLRWMLFLIDFACILIGLRSRLGLSYQHRLRFRVIRRRIISVRAVQWQLCWIMRRDRDWLILNVWIIVPVRRHRVQLRLSNARSITLLITAFLVKISFF